MPPQPGETLAGKYEIVRLIGRGAMGSVFEAKHIRLGQRVAIKFMRSELIADRQSLVRFEREARHASRLTGVHVARVSDVDVTPTGIPYIISEYLDGHNFAQELKTRGRLPVAEAVDCVLQACAAIAEAHALGIVHRDLKSANLFLEQKGDSRTIKVLDFGICKALSSGIGGDLEVTTTGMTLGSPRYMAPEQIQSAKDVDLRADIWSLGVILYRAITGQFPFEADTLPAQLVAVVSRPTPSARAIRPEIPKQLDAVLFKALQKQPSDRYATIEDFSSALAPFAVSEKEKEPARLSLTSLIETEAELEPDVLSDEAIRIGGGDAPIEPTHYFALFAEVASIARGTMSRNRPILVRFTPVALGVLAFALLAMAAVETAQWWRHAQVAPRRAESTQSPLSPSPHMAAASEARPTNESTVAQSASGDPSSTAASPSVVVPASGAPSAAASPAH